MGNLDINIGKLKKNAFRYSKVRGETASRIRIPGGVIDAKSMGKVVEIAEKYGTGVINITLRRFAQSVLREQGFFLSFCLLSS